MSKVGSAQPDTLQHHPGPGEQHSQTAGEGDGLPTSQANRHGGRLQPAVVVDLAFAAQCRPQARGAATTATAPPATATPGPAGAGQPADRHLAWLPCQPCGLPGVDRLA